MACYVRTIIVLLFFSLSTFSQSLSIRKAEWCWAIAHPFAAIKVKIISKRCDKIYNNQHVLQALDGFNAGGTTDAYRHTFYMAAFAQCVKIRKLRKLGEAHEKTNHRQFLNSKVEEGELPDSLSSVMDLYNNNIGLWIGKKNKKLPLEHLSEKVIDELKSGQGVIMKRNKKGLYLNCNNEITDLPHSSKKWSVDKCLVPSNYKAID